MQSKRKIGLLVAILATAVWWKCVQAPKAIGDHRERLREHPAVRGADPVAAAFDRLASVPQAAASMPTLSELGRTLQSLPPDAATVWIRLFLESKRDRHTGLSFVPASDGSLTEWPTFRTFLLDHLSAIDPAAAAEISRDILTTHTTPDEWALALRNTGRFETSEAVIAFMRSKTEELITHPAWQDKPTAGYLNAFDVLVFTESVASTPILSALIQRKDRSDLTHAGFLTLDRLVQRKPAEVLQVLANDTALREARPEMVAQQIARADIRVPAQLAIMKTWLLDPSRTPAELNAFTAVYPNENRFSSNNLLSREIRRTGAEIAAHDQAASMNIRNWLQDPAFQPVRDQLLKIEKRLQSYVGGR